MAHDDETLESSSSQDRQQELEAGFLDWLGCFGTNATVDDLAASVFPVVDAAKDSDK